jgi:hypothetical protein
MGAREANAFFPEFREEWIGLASVPIIMKAIRPERIHKEKDNIGPTPGGYPIPGLTAEAGYNPATNRNEDDSLTGMHHLKLHQDNFRSSLLKSQE